MEIEEIPDEAQKEWDELLVDAVRNEDVAAVETGDAITPCLTPSASPASPAAMTADQTKKGPTVTTFRTRLTSHRVSHLPAPDLLGHPRRSQSTDKPSGMARPSWFARARSSIFTLTVPGILYVCLPSRSSSPTRGHGPSLEHVGTARMAMNTHLRGCLRAPPALVNEQIAIATAPLWFAQTLTYLHHAPMAATR